MQPAPQLHNEAQRLAVLEALSLTQELQEERFQRLAGVARAICRTSIALITVLDTDKQWFKASLGLGGRCTDRAISFCGHAIQDDAVFVVEDAAADARFADNPLVMTAPHIRFYAGAPISLANDIRLGTLCVIDPSPRQITALERHALTQLADVVRDELLRLAAPSGPELQAQQTELGFQAWLQWLLERRR